MSIIKELKKIIGLIDNWSYESHGGCDEDNNMTWYKGDILYTRMKFRKIADSKGFTRPYKFKRRDFKWNVDITKGWADLSGKLVLVDSKGNELVSSDMEWLSIHSPEDWERYQGQYLLSTKQYSKYYKDQEQNEKRWDYVRGNN